MEDSMSTLEQKVNKIEVSIDKVEREAVAGKLLAEKLDVTIEKLTEVSARVSEILAVQGFRLDGQEKVTEQLQQLIEKRRVETEENIRLLHTKIDGVNFNLSNEIKTSNEKMFNEIREELKSMRTDNNTHNTESKKQIASLEKWMWTGIGAIAVIVFLFELFVK